jgi:DNA-binding NarL/FixJ family response regulator
MLRCAIVDDSPPFLDAARNLLERQGASVIGVAHTADEAIRRIEVLRPDVLLLDVNLADASGFQLARRLTQEISVELGPMILISTQADHEYIELILDSPVAVSYRRRRCPSPGSASSWHRHDREKRA